MIFNVLIVIVTGDLIKHVSSLGFQNIQGSSQGDKLRNVNAQEMFVQQMMSGFKTHHLTDKSFSQAK